MPLVVANLGEEDTIEKCEVQRDLKRHVESLGLLPGEMVTALSRNAGNRIMKGRESRLDTHMGLASKISVA